MSTYIDKVSPRSGSNPVLKVLSDMTENRVPLKWLLALKEDQADLVEVALKLLSVLCWHGVDTRMRVEVLKDDSQIEVLHAVEHAFEMNSFDLVYIKHKEGRLTQGHEAVSCWSNLDHLPLRATLETKLIFRDVNLERSVVP